MKIKFILNPWILFLSLVCLINASRAQSVGNGRVEARFSIDGDLMADTAFFGNVSVSSSKGKPSDDWFKNKYSGSGIGVIDTSGSWKYKNLLISSATARDTLVFTMPMSVPKLTRSGGFIMLDALYARDYFDQDQTVITSGSKTVDDPSSWNIGSGTVQSKDELMEFYSHVRRKGATVWDSLFFYFGVGVHGITGNKNVAAELFVNDVRLNKTTGKLTNLGSDGGRVAWLFDASGNVTKVGDMVFSMSYQPSSGGFSIEPRIWVNDSSRKTGPGAVPPVNFNWGSQFDKQTSTDFGFADIEPLSGASFSQGVSNNTDTSQAAPWGTIESGAAHGWQTHYDADQFIEMSVNLTSLGVDPGLFDNIDPCAVPYRTVVFRSRASVSFNSDLADIAGPYPFWRYPRVSANIKGQDTLNCTKTSGNMFADSSYSLAWYHWTATNGGNITAFNADSTEITYNKPGMYVLECAPLQGCFTYKDTVVVVADTAHPVAFAEAYDSLILGSVNVVKLYGGDSTASVANTSSNGFGNSAGIQFQWFGPSGYLANQMQPLATLMGNYYLTVTELRNGCTDTASTYLALLPVEIGNLNCTTNKNTIILNWNIWNTSVIKNITVDRVDASGMYTIATLDPDQADESGRMSFIDINPKSGVNHYQIHVWDDHHFLLAFDACASLFQTDKQKVHIFPNPVQNQLEILTTEKFENAFYEIHDAAGRLQSKGTLSNGEKLDVNHLEIGNYFLHLQIGDLAYNWKFLKVQE